MQDENSNDAVALMTVVLNGLLELDESAPAHQGDVKLVNLNEETVLKDGEQFKVSKEGEALIDVVYEFINSMDDGSLSDDDFAKFVSKELVLAPKGSERLSNLKSQVMEYARMSVIMPVLCIEQMFYVRDAVGMNVPYAILGSFMIGNIEQLGAFLTKVFNEAKNQDESAQSSTEQNNTEQNNGWELN